VRKAGGEPTGEAFLFSYEVAHDRPYSPSGVSHRYARMCAELGIDSHPHAFRHYSATELLTAGIDLRTVAATECTTYTGQVRLTSAERAICQHLCPAKRPPFSLVQHGQSPAGPALMR
jgi:integrase